VVLRRRKPPFFPTKAGRIKVNLAKWEREMLADLPSQLRQIMSTDDPSLRRLFPVAYIGDEERNNEYQRLMRDELLASRLAAAEVLEKQAFQSEISTDDLLLWMNTLNSVRLVIGTQLDVSESELELDDDDPRSPAYGAYGWLGYLVEFSVRALQGGDDDEYDYEDMSEDMSADISEDFVDEERMSSGEEFNDSLEFDGVEFEQDIEPGTKENPVEE
jgi:hypothetical protein